MKKDWVSFFIFFIVLLSTSCNQSNRLNSKISSVEEELKLILEKSKAAGFAMAVIEGDEVVYSRGFGFRDLENQLPVDENTLFSIGSCTKAFTSALLGILESEGKLSFDDNPAEYISELEFWNEDIGAQITLDVISRHRTGLPRYEIPMLLFPLKDRKSLIRRVRFYEPKYKVGEKFLYNNQMYALLGIVAERIEKRPWKELIEEKIFTPLEMTASNCSTEGLVRSGNSALGYKTLSDGSNKSEENLDISAMGLGPAGGINSNVIEMARWVKSWLNDGMYNGKPVLPGTYVHNLTDSIGTFEYRHGWLSGFYKGIKKLEHGGNIAGFTSKIILFPEQEIGVVVLVNQTDSVLPQAVINTVSDAVLDLNKTDWIEQFKIGSKNSDFRSNNNKNNTVPDKVTDLTAFSGTYSHPGLGTLRICNKNDTLFINAESGDLLFLKHYEKNVFDLFWPGKTVNEFHHIPYLMNFISNETGAISGIKVYNADGDLHFMKIDSDTRINNQRLSLKVEILENIK